MESDVSIIAVGTPSTNQGHLNLDYIFNTAKQIGEVLKEKDSFHVIAIRSTVLPGTNKKYGEIIEKESTKKRNIDFGVVSNPEFLREGTAVNDYRNPPVTVLGSDNEKALGIMEKIFELVNAPIEKVDIEVAEIIKYVNNSFHALKIVFANEIGNVCKKMGIDSNQVMDLFKMDKQLNISSYYFNPGFAYGGSCLPKDLKGLKTLAHDLYLSTPVINSIADSNEIQKELAYDIITNKESEKIGVLGLSFKPGTDDLRYSPIVDVIEKLLGKGYEVKIYDPNVKLQLLVGKNKSYISEKLPHINKLFNENIEEVIDWAETIILTNKEKVFSEFHIPSGKNIVDLAHYSSLKKHESYEGICW